MQRIRDFTHEYLDPGARLGEMLFGLIMALGFTGAVRLGLEEPDNRALFLGILGCNIAWGVVDGVMYVLTAMFDRGRRARIIREVLSSPTEETAIARVAEELDDRLVPLTTPEERRQIYSGITELARRAHRERVHVSRADLMGGTAAGLAVILATLPVVLPYLVFRNPHLAARLSHLIGLALLFVLGAWWGRVVGGSPWRIGAGLTAVGCVLVGLTIAMGG
jgi:hypothetical protein